MPAGATGCGAANIGHIQELDCPINFIEAIHAHNENIGIALRLFCEKRHMTRSDTTSQPASCPAASVSDADQWCEIYFPGVEDLLRHLAQGQADRRKMVRSLLFGSRTMVTLCVACFICVPGWATPAILLMKSGNFSFLRTQQEQVSAKADRLPLIQPIRHFGDAQPVPFAAIGNHADLFARAALRGGIENVLFAEPPSNPPAPSSSPSSPVASNPPASIPSASNTHKTRHSARRVMAVVTPATEDDPQPTSPQPSLLEKLFDAIVSVSQSPRQT
jgi:hypothetical protein